MKKITLIILIISVLASCKSSKKMLEKGDYNGAVNTAVKKLQSKPSSQEDLDILTKAYPLANQQDMDRIKFLKTENQASAWEEIYNLYQRLKDRQDLVKTVIPLLPARSFYMESVDYSQPLIEAKQKATDYLYTHAKKLMESDQQEPNRNAYTELLKIKNLYPDYKDVNSIINTAKDKGTTYVLVTIKNSTGTNFTDEFKRNVLSFDSKDLSKDWVQYYIMQVKDKANYDYSVFVNIKDVRVSPEQVKETRRTEKKSVSDGYEYEYDAKGNVKKDADGNDIKKPKFKTISCDIIENSQNKSSRVEGSVDYVDNRSNQILKTFPFITDKLFENHYVSTNGDRNALSDETKKVVQNGKPMSFPSDYDLIYQSSVNLSKQVRDILYSNRYLLK